MSDYMFGRWQCGDPPADGTKASESWDCGGTAHLLPAERARASFDVLAMTTIIDGGEKRTARRRWLWNEGDQFDNSKNHFLGRKQLVAQHAERFIGLHNKFTGKFFPEPMDIVMMTNATRNQGAFGLHYGAFCSTLLSQCTNEQKMKWLMPAYTMKIVGCLAQTELGHGSNVRALQTTAVYDRSTEEFILNTPTLRAMKWWPGGLGKQSTHTCVYAQLIIEGKEYGFHTFLLQLRDEKHMCLPGIELGEIGPKIGDNGTETGYLRIQDVRIPRDWMLMKHQQVTKDGQYVVSKKASGSKVQYSTMLSIRAGLVMGAGYRLAQGVTIATRYSCVRHQGFANPEEPTTRLSREVPVLDYQMQQRRVLGQLAVAYGFIFTGKHLNDKFAKIKAAMDSDDDSQDLSDLPEIHATSAGLKAMCTGTAADGLEECRKCCGGHGVMLASGIAQIYMDYVTYCTAEGDRVILELQSARYLVKCLERARSGEAIAGACDYLTIFNNPDFRLSSIPACTAVNFRDRHLLVDLLRHRALIAVVKAADGIKRSVKSGMVPAAALNDNATALVMASRAHCWFVVLRNFVAETDAASDPAVLAALARLCELLGLTIIEGALGDWIGHLSAEQGAAVSDAVREVLKEVRPDAVALTDAFEFPDNVLNSALGRHDGNVYESLYANAKISPLNDKEVFDGYKHLQTVLDAELIKKTAKMVRHTPRSRM